MLTLANAFHIDFAHVLERDFVILAETQRILSVDFCLFVRGSLGEGTWPNSVAHTGSASINVRN